MMETEAPVTPAYRIWEINKSLLKRSSSSLSAHLSIAIRAPTMLQALRKRHTPAFMQFTALLTIEHVLFRS